MATRALRGASPSLLSSATTTTTTRLARSSTLAILPMASITSSRTVPSLTALTRQTKAFQAQKTRAIHSTPHRDIVEPLSYEIEKGTKSQIEYPIIFLHGLFGSKRNNKALGKALAQATGRSVWGVDLRNHGESPHSPRHDYPSMAEDVAAFINSFNITRPTIIGHSMGAKVAMTLALSKPQTVKDIVVVDNAPVDTALSPDFARYVQAMRHVERAKVESRKEVEKIMEGYNIPQEVRNFLLLNIQRKPLKDSSEHYTFKVPLITLGNSLTNMGDFPHSTFIDPHTTLLTSFRKPALFVRGTKSSYVPDEVIPIIGTFFPKFRMVDIDAGHWVTAEKPVQFQEAVVEFLNREEDPEDSQV